MSAVIVGYEATPEYASKGEAATMVWEDEQVRTPSDHFGVVSEFIYSN